MSLKIRPLHDSVIVRRKEEERTSAGGIVIPDTATAEKPVRGVVVAIGTGKILDNGEVRALDVKVNDEILFGKYSGTEVKIDGTEYLVMREEDNGSRSWHRRRSCRGWCRSAGGSAIPPFLPAMSHSAMSTAPIERTVATRARAHEQFVEPLAVERVLPHHDRLQKADQPGAVEAGRVRRGAEKGVALDALVGHDPQQAEVALAGRPRRVVAVGGRRNALPGEQGQSDVGDLHGRPRRGFLAPRPRSNRGREGWFKR